MQVLKDIFYFYVVLGFLDRAKKSSTFCGSKMNLEQSLVWGFELNLELFKS